MKNKIWLFTLVILYVNFLGCFVPQNPYTGLAPGMWRAELKLEPYVNKSLDDLDLKDTRANILEVENGELPFTFEVKYENDTKFYIEIINGEERIRVDDIIIGRDRKTAKDTIRIEFPNKVGYIHGIYQENIIEGEWVPLYNELNKIPFTAKQGQNHRFTTLRETPMMDVSGKWEMNFEANDENMPTKVICEFQQKDNYLTANILTEPVNHQHLEGTVQANKFYLSYFDGALAFLFEAKIQPDSTLIGTWRSRSRGIDFIYTWDARRSPL